MSTVVLVTAQPRRAVDGAIVTVRMAGGGHALPYIYKGTNDWRAGLKTLPRFSAKLAFDASGWAGASAPVQGPIVFAPSTIAAYDELAGYIWTDADVLVETVEEGGSIYRTELVGTVASITTDAGMLTFTVADASVKLGKPILIARFAGSGGLEGGTDATGRIKRRSWGRVFNVEGRVLDKANNIYEFGDPAFRWKQFDAVRDLGRAGPRIVVAWAGSADATLDALRAAVPPVGGAAVAPDICCVKWWTQPSLLTADIRGEIGTAYAETAPEIAAAILAIPAVPLVNLSEATAWRSAACGYHAGDEGETMAQALDRILLGVSLVWILEPIGNVRLRQIAWTAPVETLMSRGVVRQQELPAMKTRRLGYQRNNRVQSEGEIITTLLTDDLGRYSASTVYMQGNIVDLADGSRWKYVNPTAAAGKTPSAMNSSWWARLTPPTDPAALGLEPGATRNVFRGAWAANTTYARGDTVFYNGSSYYVTAAHTSVASAPPPNANVSLQAQAGTPGSSSQPLLTEYSVDGTDDWHSDYGQGDAFFRTSNDGGATWSTAARFLGEEGAPGLDGQYTSFIWRRSATKPARSTSNSVVPSGWSDAPPADNGQPLWLSNAPFRGTARLDDWSDPIQMTPYALITQWSATGAGNWHGDFAAGDMWFRTSTDGGATWSRGAKAVGENGTDGSDGMDGQHTNFIFQRSGTQPDTPTSSKLVPDGWSDAPPADNGQALWMSRAPFRNLSKLDDWSSPIQLSSPPLLTQWSVTGSTNWHIGFGAGDRYWRTSNDGGLTWTTPAKVVGENGSDGSAGADGQFTDFVFRRAAAKPSTPTSSSLVPSGWADAPPADDGNPLWMTRAQFQGTKKLGSWSTPIQLSSPPLITQWASSPTGPWDDDYAAGDVWWRSSTDNGATFGRAVRVVGENGGAGSDGIDGQYVSFVFRRSATPPVAPTSSRIVPTDWSDDPPAANGSPLWMTSAPFRGVTKLGTWSTPVQIEGPKGDKGDKGDKGSKGDAGRDAIPFFQSDEPDRAIEGDTWLNPDTKVWKIYQGGRWVAALGKFAAYDLLGADMIVGRVISAQHLVLNGITVDEIGDGAVSGAVRAVGGTTPIGTGMTAMSGLSYTAVKSGNPLYIDVYATLRMVGAPTGSFISAQVIRDGVSLFNAAVPTGPGGYDWLFFYRVSVRATSGESVFTFNLSCSGSGGDVRAFSPTIGVSEAKK